MKPFISPLLLLFFVFTVLWIGAFLRGGISFGARMNALLLGVVGALLYLAATVPGSEWLRSTLPGAGAPPEGFVPESIIVLEGGFTRGRSPEADVLSSTSAMRVQEGAQQWRNYPEAQFILSGSGPDEEGREAGHVTQLMAGFAAALGVDEERIRVESASQTTRAHPRALREADLVRPDENILVVTSDWHLLRAKGEFDRTFSNVKFVGAAAAFPPVNDWRRWLPREEVLWQSTHYVREWAGRVSYAFQALRLPRPLEE